MSRSRPTRRGAALALALVALAGLSLASAAQLSMSAGTLQAGSTAVGSCQPTATPVAVSFTSAYSAAAPAGYRATAVTFSNVAPACGGFVLRARVLDATGAPLGAELTGTVPASGGSLTLSFGALAVTSISSVAAVIS